MSQPAGSGREPRPPRHSGGRAGGQAAAPAAEEPPALLAAALQELLGGGGGTAPFSHTAGPGPATRSEAVPPPRSPPMCVRGGGGQHCRRLSGLPRTRREGGRDASFSRGHGGGKRPPRGVAPPRPAPAWKFCGHRPRRERRRPPPPSPHGQRGRAGGEGARAAAELPNGRAVLVPTPPAPGRRGRGEE